ncbi:nucleotidyltransferase family protein [Bacillus sp. DTU_2020_1000418_1_SI_GHA_SEK_038]|uniref:nucleotidyltransferase family protein n=1 Tax=Bacillus sp. DTU_2020_1000418_1_SI_GHA_SEK_038 TaxID=3077585 RepID=UPI0028E51BEF|nr:nucleotidyltransferase family protein [Bacillus sp. DTU_2020_1000418_1_SI_GHA_SEK_038]WNS74946.1 nucleotidyltransferase family protein [Bacillus sp. DTU_2020_1000418_1_SI_GHA_SEK_038]
MNEHTMNPSICAIILAAGTSSRMGQPKQLLELKGRPLLEHVIRSASTANFSEIITVIGCEADKIQKTISIKDPRFRWVVNKDYLSGQGSSLKTGIAKAGSQHSGVMVFLGDLPFISQSTVQTIFQIGKDMLKNQDESFVIRPEFNGMTGHPVFFGHLDRNLFMQIQGDQGAKAIISKISTRQSISVEDSGILFDVDTPEVYEKARNLNK